MQKLTLQNAGYQHLEKGFKEWLDILGYCDQYVKGTPILVREFLHYLERCNVQSIGALEQKHIKAYHDHIGLRPNQRRGGGLNTKTINKQIIAIEKLLEYLHHKGVQHLPATGIRLAKPQHKEPVFLSAEEIKELFALTYKPYPKICDSQYAAYMPAQQSRDRAMLAVFYSCGLRRNEGVHVSIDDINFDTRLLHVKKGKLYKERFVPFGKTTAEYLKEWIYDYRSQWIKEQHEGRLFINMWGQPMAGGTLYDRLKLLQQLSENTALTDKIIGLHSLRHSIATHLLAAGMTVEKIAKFLGHSSMDSTQIYTHLVTKENSPA